MAHKTDRFRSYLNSLSTIKVNILTKGFFLQFVMPVFFFAASVFKYTK